MKKAFVSSTFLDFQVERDILREKVYPYVHSFVKQHHEYFAFQDLRWGVDTNKLNEHDASVKIINYCLDEIARSKPYFIVFLGDYYGTALNANIIKTEANRHKLFLNDYQVSLTELEVRYALKVLDGDYSHMFVYDRKIIGKKGLEGGTQKLNDLKKELREKCGANYKEYTIEYEGDKIIKGLDILEDLIKRDVINMLSKDIKEILDLDDYQKEQLEVSAYFAHKAECFSARQDELKDMLNYIEKGIFGHQSAFSITACHGAGKTTLMAKFYETLKEKYDVFTFECGQTENSHSTFQIMQSIMHLLGNKYGIKLEKSLGSIKEDYVECIKRADSLNKPLFILIDGVDQLDKNTGVRFLEFIVDDLKNIRFIMTGVDEISSMKSNIQELKMAPLTKDDKNKIVKQILETLGKELNQEVIDFIIDNEKITTPLHIEYLITYLSLLKKEDFEIIYEKLGNDFTKYEKQVISNLPEDLDALAYELIIKMANGDDVLLDVMKMIAVSYRGLTIEQIQHSLVAKEKELDVSEFNRFVNYIPDFFFVSNDGKYYFFHNSFKNGLLANISEQEKWHNYEILSRVSLILRENRVEMLYYAYCLRNPVLFFFFYLANGYFSYESVFEFISMDNGENLIAILEAIEEALKEVPTTPLFKAIAEMAGRVYMYFEFKGNNADIALTLLTALNKAYGKVLEIVLKENVALDLFQEDNRFLFPSNELMIFHFENGHNDEALKAVRQSLEYAKQICDTLGLDFEKVANYEITEEKFFNKPVEQANEEYIKVILERIENLEKEDNPISYKDLAIAYSNYSIEIEKRGDKDKGPIIAAILKSVGLRKKVFELNIEDYANLQVYMFGLNRLLSFTNQIDNHHYENEVEQYVEEYIKLREHALRYTNLTMIFEEYVCSSYNIASFFRIKKKDFVKSREYLLIALNDVIKGSAILKADRFAELFIHIFVDLASNKELYQNDKMVDDAILASITTNLIDLYDSEQFASVDVNLFIECIYRVANHNFTKSGRISFPFVGPLLFVLIKEKENRSDLHFKEMFAETCVKFALIHEETCKDDEEKQEVLIAYLQEAIEASKDLMSPILVNAYTSARNYLYDQLEDKYNKEALEFWLESIETYSAALNSVEDKDTIKALIDVLVDQLAGISTFIDNDKTGSADELFNKAAELVANIASKNVLPSSEKAFIHLAIVINAITDYLFKRGLIEKQFDTGYFAIFDVLLIYFSAHLQRHTLPSETFPLVARTYYHYLYYVKKAKKEENELYKIAIAFLGVLNTNFKELYDNVFDEEEKAFIEKCINNTN